MEGGHMATRTCQQRDCSLAPGRRATGSHIVLLRRSVKRFRGGLILKVHRRVYHSPLCGRVIKRKKKPRAVASTAVA